MAEFYFPYNKRSHFNAPQFTRMRHRYRGVRESEKINLEIDQFAFSIRKLYVNAAEFKTSFRDRATTLMRGGEVETVEDEAENTLSIMGLNDMAAKLESLKQRVEILER